MKTSLQEKKDIQARREDFASDGGAGNWQLIDWDGNPALKLKCWRKKFGRGHVSVGCGDFLAVVFSFGADSEKSHSSTRWNKSGEHMSEAEAMARIDAQHALGGCYRLTLTHN